MNKDQRLLEEAYQQIQEASLTQGVQNAIQQGRYTINSLIDKGKAALGVKYDYPRLFGQTWEDWAKSQGIEPPPFSKRDSNDNYDKAAQEAWDKKYPRPAAWIKSTVEAQEKKRAYDNSPEGRQANWVAHNAQIAAANRKFRQEHTIDSSGKWV